MLYLRIKMFFTYLLICIAFKLVYPVKLKSKFSLQVNIHDLTMTRSFKTFNINWNHVPLL